jgi:hypothetical protein
MQTTKSLAMVLAGVFSIATLADVPTNGPGSADTSSTATNPVNLNFSYACRGDGDTTSSSTGTRAVAGTWDTSTGALNVTVTLTNCIGPGGLSVTGTDVITGTVLQGKSPNSLTIDTSETINTKATSATGNIDLTRTCTITRNGSFAQDAFSGKTTRNNCTLDGTYREIGTDVRDIHMLENLLKRAVNIEDE